MDAGLDLAPIPAERRTASLADVLLLFAGANIVTTTLVTGGSLAPAHSFPRACALIGAGVILATLPLAWLARLGPRHGLPTMVLLRHPFGTAGAAGVSALLVLTNFAWIALNNLIAAQAIASLAGGAPAAWSVGVGAAAVAVALFGPRAMALFDRVAVPLLLLVGAALTVALFGEAGRSALSRPGEGGSLLAGFDVVVGYQVSWSLMFADYTRFQRRERRASLAVFLGLALSSLWLMTVGAGAGMAGGGNSPTQMILGLGLPVSALVLMALSTITTNFVNIYLSALALKTLSPRLPDTLNVLLVGALGTALGVASPRLLEGYAGFMGWIATLLLPILAVAAMHFLVAPQPGLDPARPPRWRPSALLAWLAGVGTYQILQIAAPSAGSTLPTLAVTAVAYVVLRRRV